MKKILPAAFVVASCALGLGLAAGSLATASYAPVTSHDDFTHGTEIDSLPQPVFGAELFFEEGMGTSCMNREQVVDIFLSDQTAFGGRTVTIVEERDQAFADYWRDQLGITKVAVSGVVGHMFMGNGDDNWTIDLVEFDSAGCAMSRTLLPVDLWTELVQGSADA